MKFNHIILIGLSLLFSVVSCNENQMEQGMGYLDLRVSCDTEVNIVPVVKSGEGTAVISATLTPLFGGESIFVEDVNQITEPIKLKTGDYKVVATSGTDQGSAAFDAPFYYGESQFTVRNMQMATSEVVCTLASVKVTAEFSSAFTTSFDYKLTVSNGEATLEFSEAAGTLDKAAYFHVTDELSWTLDVTNAKGEVFTLTESYTEVAARQYYDLYFDVEKESSTHMGAGGFVITVDNSFNVKEYDMPIFIYPDIPVIMGSEKVSFYSVEAVESALYEIVSTKGYKSVVVSHNSTLFTALGLPESVELMNASEETLQALAVAGIVLDFADVNGEDTGTLVSNTTDIDADFAQLLGKLSKGNYSFTISATNELDLTSSITVNVDVLAPAEITSINAWAKFVVVKGRYFVESAPEGLTIEYMTGSSDWTKDNILIQEVNESSKTYKVMICKLSENTTYSFRTFISKDGALDDVISAKTESSSTIPNMNFDQWGTSSVVYPYTGKNNGVWDTANEGLSSLSTINITTKESSDVISGNAVRMESKTVNIVGVTKFAAGNIYTGDFEEVTISPAGAKLNWGVRFTGRPVAMKGYYKYAPQPITAYDNSHSNLKNQPDKCSIQVALADGTTSSSNNSNYYYFVDTGANKFVDFSTSNKTLIAYNKIETGETISTYRAFTLPLGYRDVNKTPSYAIVACCASYLGDYFTGGEGSVMLADEFEFIYDPSDESLTDEQRRDFFNLF